MRVRKRVNVDEGVSGGVCVCVCVCEGGSVCVREGVCACLLFV